MAPGSLVRFMVVTFLAAAHGKSVPKNQYVDYRPGNINVILSAPHGGDLRPSSIPDRPSAGCWDNIEERCIFTHDCDDTDSTRCRAVTTKDLWTRELTEAMASEIESVFGGRPHIVINLLHRIKLDANRDIGEAAFGVPEAEDAWTFYQNSINQSKAAIGGMGIFLDIHGQSHPEEWIELGYLHSGADLDLDNIDPNQGSLKNLANHVSGTTSYESLLRGDTSFGTCIENNGYETVPSNTNRGPSGGNYFSGGYNTRIHGSRTSGTIDAIQIESPRYLRDEVMGPVYAGDLVTCLRQFMQRHYPSTKVRCSHCNQITPSPNAAGAVGGNLLSAWLRDYVMSVLVALWGAGWYM